jgi:hypothetical protein
MRFACLIALLSLSCVKDGGPQVSAPRLQLLTIKAKNGTAEIGTALYDTQMQMRCLFDPDEDGNFYCFPTAQIRAFVDAACTRPVWGSAVCNDKPLPKYAVRVEDTGDNAAAKNTCNGSGTRRHTVYPVVNAGQSANGLFTISKDGCVPMTNTIKAVFPLGEPIDKSELIPAAPEQEVRGDGFTATVLVTDEGARQDIRVLHETIGQFTVAKPDPAAPEQLYAMPRTYGTISPGAPYYADASCAGEPVAIFNGPCAAALVQELSSEVVCQRSVKPSLFHSGSAVDAVYTADALSCGPATDTNAVRKGAPMPFTELPPLSYVANGDGRLQARDTVNESGNVVLRAAGGVFYDQKAEAECFTQDFNDGRAYCMPAGSWQVGGGSATQVFSDPQCKVGLLRNVTPSPGCPAVDIPLYAYAYVDRSLAQASCLDPNTIAALYSVGAEYTGQVYERPQIGPCQAAPNVSGFTFHEVGNPLPFSELEELQVPPPGE